MSDRYNEERAGELLAEFGPRLIPATDSKEMVERAKVLELHLQRLVQKKPPRRKPATSNGNGSSSKGSGTAAPSAVVTGKEENKPVHEEL